MAKVLALGATGPIEQEVATVAGTDRSIQFNNNGQQGGAATKIDADGNLLLTVDNTPPVPSAGTAVLHLRERAGRAAIAVRDTSATIFSAQASLVSNSVWSLQASGRGSSVVSNFNFTPTIVGTASGAPLVTTSYCGSCDRIRYTSAAAVEAISSVYTTGYKALYAPTLTATQNGFTMVFRFNVADGVIRTDSRMFVGVSTSASAPTSVNPSTLVNCIGLIKDTASTTLAVFSAGSGAGVSTTLDANFPVNTTNTDVYEFILHNPKDTAIIYWEVLRVNTGAVATGSITNASLLPVSGSFLAPRIWRTSGATSGNCALDIHLLYGDHPR
jgi:hypothetical protein